MLDHQRRERIILRPLRSELAPLDMQHQISTADILHDKVDACFGLKTSVEIQQEWMSRFISDDEDIPLGFGALDFIVLDDELLFQDLNSI